ncbi:hypothetical protein [Streptomyces sp. NPDC020681]|uniref:effector-associated constant component EACC1 n=1 Tax=Streptomyces sp. NPDC020681 TaxID=3365083 RepID=UPI0037B47190
MEIQLSVPGDSAAVIHLHDWLRRDERTRGLGPRLHRPATPPGASGGPMGGLELVNVILSNSIAFTSLAVTLASWRTARRSAPSATEVRVTSGTTTVTITDASAEQIEQILRSLTAPGTGPVAGTGASTGPGAGTGPGDDREGASS